MSMQQEHKKKLISPLFEYRLFNFDLLYFSDMVCSVAGITSDANVLTNELRVIGNVQL